MCLMPQVLEALQAENARVEQFRRQERQLKAYGPPGLVIALSFAVQSQQCLGISGIS